MLQSNDTVTNDSDLSWPDSPSAILIMGKRQGTKKENKQLWGRVAMAAALWYSAPQPKPYLIFTAADIHGPQRTPDAQVVKTMLVERFEIPADFVILRQLSNCTLLEVRVARVVQRAYGLAHIFALTHLYHAVRAQRYFNEVLPNTSVIPVHPDILTEINFPPDCDELLAKLRRIIADSQPGYLDLIREYSIEWFLSQTHRLDPRGRLERGLAKLLRPGVEDRG